MPWHNGPILTIAEIINFVMSSSTESELAAMFLATKKMVTLRQTLVEICWLQPPSPLQTENSTAAGITNNTIVPCHTKAMDMRFYWLRCRAAQYQLCFIAPLGESTGATTSPSITRHCTMKPTEIPTLDNPCLPHILAGRQSSGKKSPILIFLFTSMITRLPFLLQGCVVLHLVHTVVHTVHNVERGCMAHMKLTRGSLTPLTQWLQ